MPPPACVLVRGRYQIATGNDAAGAIARDLVVRETAFTAAGAGEPIQELFRLLVENEERNTLVCGDICDALAHGRRCLVPSQWKEHCNLLADGLRSRGFSPVALEGGLGKRARAALLAEIERTPLSEPLVVVATGQYLGEGFDCPQLGTLFLAFPVSFKGRLVQYTGRLLRAHDNKESVCVYDYADVRVPVLRAMHTPGSLPTGSSDSGRTAGWRPRRSSPFLYWLHDSHRRTLRRDARAAARRGPPAA